MWTIQITQSKRFGVFKDGIFFMSFEHLWMAEACITNKKKAAL